MKRAAGCHSLYRRFPSRLSSLSASSASSFRNVSTLLLPLSSLSSRLRLSYAPLNYNSLTLFSPFSTSASSALPGFSPEYSREGDWACPSCGSISFSWRVECFNCGTIRPSADINAVALRKKSKSLLSTSPSSSSLDKRARKKEEKKRKKELKKEGVQLKEMLQLAKRSKQYDVVLHRIDKILSSKKHIKSSIVATMLTAYGKSGQVDKALDLFGQIGSHPFIRKRPTQYHYSAVINACAENRKWEEAVDILDKMRMMRYSEDKKLKYREPPNLFVFGAVMAACSRSDRHDKALEVFDTALEERKTHKGPPKDTVLFNQALLACSKLKRYKRAYDLYDLMYEHKINRNEVTYGTMLAICDAVGDAVLANEIIRIVRCRNAIEFTLPMYSSAIGAFTKGGEARKAMELFEEAKSSRHILLDSPIYSKAFDALAALGKETKLKSDNNDDTDDLETKSESPGLRALNLLAEMTKRNLRISQYALVRAIETLITTNMRSEAVTLYTKGESNGVFSSTVEEVKGSQRRLDLRRDSLPMVTVKLCALMGRMLDNNETSTDLMLILGNSNKALLPDVTSLLKSGPTADAMSKSQEDSSEKGIRSIVQQNGTVIRIPKASMEKWIQLKKSKNK